MASQTPPYCRHIKKKRKEKMTNLSKKIKNKKQTVPIYRLEYVNPHYFMYLQLHTRLEIVKN